MQDFFPIYGSKKSYEKAPTNNIFSYGLGRSFSRWIDSAGSRSSGSTGYTAGISYIQNPAYCIESILRDEVFIERDLEITTVPVDPFDKLLTCDGLMSSVDDYYINAIIYNATRQWTDYISDYVGSTKQLTLAVGGHTIWPGDKFYLTNVQGDNRIDDTSFDVVGNTTNGLRDGWKFRIPLTQTIQGEDLINKLCLNRIA